ncbi:kinase-like protein, partial [Rickenella mellea]
SLVSPWMPLGTACVYLKDKSVHERFRVITEVADGLSYLHRHDVVHGDLKGDNILIGDRGESRLADFGLSKLLTEVNIDTGGSQPTATQTTLGTIRWMARELLNGDARGVNCETDVWAYGMTILELLTCLRPYHDEKTEYVVIVNIMNGKLPMYPGSECGLSEDLWALCLQCWDLNPALRPTMRVMAKRVWELDLRCDIFF